MFSFLFEGVIGNKIFFEVLGVIVMVVVFVCVFFLKELEGLFVEYYEGEEEVLKFVVVFVKD